MTGRTDSILCRPCRGTGRDRLNLVSVPHSTDRRLYRPVDTDPLSTVDRSVSLLHGYTCVCTHFHPVHTHLCTSSPFSSTTVTLTVVVSVVLLGQQRVGSLSLRRRDGPRSVGRGDHRGAGRWSVVASSKLRTGKTSIGPERVRVSRVTLVVLFHCRSSFRGRYKIVSY